MKGFLIVYELFHSAPTLLHEHIYIYTSLISLQQIIEVAHCPCGFSYKIVSCIPCGCKCGYFLNVDILRHAMLVAATVGNVSKRESMLILPCL